MGMAKMRVRFFLIAAALLSCRAAFAAGAADGLVKSSSLSRDSILIGDQTVWNLELETDAGDTVLILPYSATLQLDTTGAKVEAVSDFVLDTVSLKGGKCLLNAKILLTSFDSGAYRLPQPLLVVAGDGGADTLGVESPLLTVGTLQIDTAQYQIKDIKGNVRYPLTFKEIVLYILIVAALVAAVFLDIRYIRYRREHKDFFGRPLVQDPPHIVALRKLDRIRSEKLWQSGKEKQYYTGITDALREYIQKRYGVGAMEMTSAEILESLKDKQIEARPYEELDELLKTADLVKFAKFSPDTAANEEAVPKAVRFVNSTFMQELEQEKEVK